MALPLDARRHPVVSRGLARLRDRCGVTDGERIVAGVSGGADSLALLITLAVRRERDGGPFEVVIIDHGLRDVRCDVAHVASVCNTIDVLMSRVTGELSDEPGGVAANARRFRYRGLACRAQQVGGHVAVAHHADDQLETMLMALGRGAGPAGLAGMRWRRPLDGDVALVRPFLDTRHGELEDVCTAAGITWRHDPTNDDMTAPRTRLRHEVAPILDALYPGVAERASGTADLVMAAEAALERVLSEEFGDASETSWPRERLAALDAPLIASGLRRAAVALSPAARGKLQSVSLFEAAIAIRDDERRPRAFDWPGLRLQVDAHAVKLSARSHIQ